MANKTNLTMIQQPNVGNSHPFKDRQLSFLAYFNFNNKNMHHENLCILLKLKYVRKTYQKRSVPTQFNNWEMNLCMPNSLSYYLERYYEINSFCWYKDFMFFLKYSLMKTSYLEPALHNTKKLLSVVWLVLDNMSISCDLHAFIFTCII